MAGVVLVLTRLIELHRSGAISIVRFKDRFECPTEGGWADLRLNCVFPEVPMVIWEKQLMHSAMFLVRHNLGAHNEYNEFPPASEIQALLQNTGRSTTDIVVPRTSASILCQRTFEVSRQSQEQPVQEANMNGSLTCSQERFQRIVLIRF